MSDEHVLYFLERAEAEIGFAQQATHPAAVAAHYNLAQSYLDLVYGGSNEKEAQDVPSASGRCEPVVEPGMAGDT